MKRRDAAVLDAGVGFEFKSCDDGTGVDLDNVAQDVELFELGLDLGGDVFQFLAIEAGAF